MARYPQPEMGFRPVLGGMSARRLSVLAFSGVLGASVLGLALFTRSAPAAAKARAAAVTSVRLDERASQLSAIAAARAAEIPEFVALPALRIVNQTTRESVDVKLYDAGGAVDEGAAQKLDQLLCDARDPKQHHVTRLNRRTLQLLFKAAYHFQRDEVTVVSGYRMPGRRREGQHGNGSAIDFRLPDVKAAELARYLRGIPRTGVGVYTHPKTQFVHLDSREQSFHWLDASPPRRRWRERSIGSKDLLAKDARYTPAVDLPDGLPAPLTAAIAP